MQAPYDHEMVRVVLWVPAFHVLKDTDPRMWSVWDRTTLPCLTIAYILRSLHHAHRYRRKFLAISSIPAVAIVSEISSSRPCPYTPSK